MHFSECFISIRVEIARISPIPKQTVINDNSDIRRISMLPFLTKVYEQLVLDQVASFLFSCPDCILKNTVSAYNGGYSTTKVMFVAIKDDITRSMKGGEVTLAVLADFSKTFNTPMKLS